MQKQALILVETLDFDLFWTPVSPATNAISHLFQKAKVLQKNQGAEPSQGGPFDNRFSFQRIRFFAPALNLCDYFGVFPSFVIGFSGSCGKA
ncbi:MAG: hypothetical protein PVG99_12920 [Desulfobacteraceae bacterium]